MVAVEDTEGAGEGGPLGIIEEASKGSVVEVVGVDGCGSGVGTVGESAEVSEESVGVVNMQEEIVCVFRLRRRGHTR